MNKAWMNQSASLLIYYYVHAATFLFFVCFEPTSPYCTESLFSGTGGGGNCVLMCSNKYSVNWEKACLCVKKLVWRLKQMFIFYKAVTNYPRGLSFLCQNKKLSERHLAGVANSFQEFPVGEEIISLLIYHLWDHINKKRPFLAILYRL